MSTTTAPQHTAGLPITRAERDAIYGELHFGLDGDASALDEASTRDVARRVELRIAFCDTLGWEVEEDREEYRLPVVPIDELRHWLTYWRDEAAETAAAETHDIEKVTSGDEMHFSAPTAAGTLRNALEYVTRQMTTAIVCLDLLERLGEVTA